MNETISIAEYAERREISVQAVYQAIKNNFAMPGVIETKKSGTTTLLIVDPKIIPAKKDLVV